MTLPLLLLFHALKQARRTPRGKFVEYETYQAVSNIASWMQTTTLGFVVLAVTHSPGSLGVSLLLGSAPQAILGLYGGVISDHAPRRITMLVTQRVMVAQSVGLCLLLIFHATNAVVLYALIALTSVLRAINQPAQGGYANEIVDACAWQGRAREKALSLDGMQSLLTWLLGSAVAGYCAAEGDWIWVFLANALSFLLILRFVKKNEFGRSRPVAHDERITPRFLAKRITSLADAVEHLKADAGRELALFTVTILCLGTVGATLPVIAEYYGGNAHKVLYTFQAIGSLLACCVRKHFKHGSGWMLYSVAGVLYGLMFSRWWEALAILFLYVMSEVTALRTKLFLRHNAPDELAGRINAVYSFIYTGGWGVSGLIAGMLIPAVGIRATVVGMSLVAAMSVVGIRAFPALHGRRKRT